AVKNDGTSDRKRFLSILSIPQMKINPETQEEYALRVDEFVDMLKKTNSYQYFIDNHNLTEQVYKEYIYYYPSLWIEKKQAYIPRWGPEIIYLPWIYMTESLQDPENYLTKKFNRYL
ncbi:21479_t:CDS:2, partial [Gigaspora rosea]